MPSLTLSASLVALLAANAAVSSFVVAPVPSGVSMLKSRFALFGIRCEDKFYQLEEMEDKETCTTELFLNTDRTITFGESNGPLAASAVGEWQVTPGTNDFTMTIMRSFNSGQSNTDMGEFDFKVARTYVGDMTMVGACVGITGATFAEAASGEEKAEVGYFNMIDSTDERAERNMSARPMSS